MTNKKRNNKKKIFSKIKNFRNNHNSNRNIFLVCICIVMIWRGTWNLLDMYVLPNNPFLSNIICIIVGIVILLIDDGKLGELGSKTVKGESEKV